MEPGASLAATDFLVVGDHVVSVGIAGLNLHIFSYVTDIGYSPLIAASFMSTIAFTQLGSTLIWGMLADRFDIRKVSCVQFLIQGSRTGNSDFKQSNSYHLLRLLSLWHRPSRQFRAAGSNLGQLLRSSLAGNRARFVAVFLPSLRRQRRAVLRISPRPDGQLQLLIHDFCVRPIDIGAADFAS